MERRLAAILAANVVGYSRLMGVDEEGTLAALKARRRDILQPMVAKHYGRIVKVMGDGVLVEFASAVSAVQCALDLQQAMAVANRDLPDDRHIVLRVGVNLGTPLWAGHRAMRRVHAARLVLHLNLLKNRTGSWTWTQMVRPMGIFIATFQCPVSSPMDSQNGTAAARQCPRRG